MLILSNDDVEGLLTMADCLQALEEAYTELAAGRAQNRPRTDLYAPTARRDAYYVFKSMEGVIPSMGVAALRINSDHITWTPGPRGTIKEKVPAARGRYAGHVELYSIETGELLAILPDGYLQKMRVGGTSGVAARRLARSDAGVLGLLGSGWQASAQVEAMAAVRRLRALRVYSPTPEHREAKRHKRNSRTAGRRGPDPRPTLQSPDDRRSLVAEGHPLRAPTKWVVRCLSARHQRRTEWLRVCWF